MVWAVTTLDPFRFQGDQDHDFLTTVDQLQPPRKSRLSATVRFTESAWSRELVY